MPRSPSNLTVASFLKKPPDPPINKRGKGKKRKLSFSPTAINDTSKKPNENPSPLTSPQLSLGTPTPSQPLTSPDPGSKETPPKTSPPLPYQLRSSQKRSNKKYSIMFSSPSSSSRMDNSLDLTNGEVIPIDELPTSDEADALLREDSEPGHQTTDELVPDSPTAAVKSAIEAQISENLDSLSNNMLSVLVPNKDIIVDSTLPPAPSLPALFHPKKPQPLFPNGLPSNCKNVGPVLANSAKATSAITPRGYYTVEGVANKQGASNLPKDTQPQKPTPKSKTTYATKAKSPPKPREMVEHILFVYSTWTNKAPIDSKDWGIVDSHLIGRELARSPSDPLIRIANSGYDATHRCGFIACRDLVSAEWCQAAIRGIGGSQYGVRGAFRAWAKGEQPEAKLCRLFFPPRFDSLDEDTLVSSLKKHNPPLQHGTVVPKGLEDVQGGRALYVEVDTISYSYIKSKGHKLEFVMMDIDCQLYNPPKRVAQSGPGVTGITKIVRPAQTLSQPTLPAAPLVFNMAAALSARLAPDDLKAAAFPQQPPNSPLKRNRSDAFPLTGGSKKMNP